MERFGIKNDILTPIPLLYESNVKTCPLAKLSLHHVHYVVDGEDGGVTYLECIDV